MNTLHVYLFGGVKISQQIDPEGDTKITRSVKALLAYLLLFRHRIHPREVLAGLFWGDHSEDRARSCLSTALWRLRSVLEPKGTPKGSYLVTTSTGEVGFNPESNHWLDVAEFEETLSSCVLQGSEQSALRDPGKFECALELYTGDLLEGFYDDWALRERERLRSLYLKSLTQLMYFYKLEQAYEKSLACGRQVLDLDPLREKIHREMMRLYLHNGQRTLAIRQYKTCCNILDEELGIPPLEETQALYQHIRQGSVDHLTPRGDQSAHSAVQLEKTAGIEQAFHKIHLAMKHFESTREQLHRAIHCLERILKSQGTQD